MSLVLLHLAGGHSVGDLMILEGDEALTPIYVQRDNMYREAGMPPE